MQRKLRQHALACKSQLQLATWHKHNHHTLTKLYNEYTYRALLNPKRSMILQKHPSYSGTLNSEVPEDSKDFRFYIWEIV